MGKASLTIAISGEYNSRAVDRARESLRRLNIEGASTAGGITEGLAKFGGAVGEFGGKVYGAGKKMESVGDAATRSITVPIAGAAAACGMAAIDIDSALTGVRKTVDGTEEQYQALKQAAIDFSETNAVSASQMLDIEALGAQLGFAIEELEEFGRVASGLDIATNMDAEQAATEMAQFANITKMSHDRISNYASTLVGLGNTSATTESDISSMAMRIAAAGTQVGMSQADILGFAAAMSSLGITAEAGGSAISTVMSKIDKAVAMGGPPLEAWAETAQMSAQDFATAWKDDPATALAEVMGGLQAAVDEGGNMSVMLEELGIKELRQTDMMKRMAGNTELVTKTVATANEEWEKNTALQAEVDNRNESMAARFEMLKNKVVAVAEQVGTPLVEALLDVVDASQPLIDTVAGAAQAFAALDQDSQQAILGVVGAAAGLGPVLSVVGKLGKGIGNVAVGFGKGLQNVAGWSYSIKSAKEDVGDAVAEVAKAGDAAKGAGTKAEKAGDQAAKAGGKAKGASGDVKAVGGAAKGAGDDMGTMAKKTDKASGSMDKAKGSAAVLKGVLGTIGASLAIGAITAAAGAIVDHLVKAEEHAKKVKEATDGLEGSAGALYDSMHRVQGSFATASEGVDGYVAKAGDVYRATDEMIEANADLAGAVKGIFSEAGTSVGTLEGYRETIDRLAGRALEDAGDVAELKLAVQGVNEQCGTSYEVAQDAEGAYQILADGAVKAKDEVLALIDAQKLQIQLDANKEAWTEAYKTIGEHAKTAADATDLYNRTVIERDNNARRAAEGDEMAAYAMAGLEQKVDDAKRAMDEANGSYEAQKGLVDSLKDAQVLFQRALDEGAESVAAAVSGNALLMASLDTAGQSAIGLVDDLEGIGVSTADLRKVGEENLPAIGQAYDGTVSSIKGTLELYGVALDEGLLKTKESAEAMEGHVASFGDKVALKFQEADVDVEGFCQKLADAGVSTEDFKTLTAEQLAQLVAGYDGDIGSIKGKLDEFVAANKEKGAAGGDGFKDAYTGKLSEAAPLAKEAAKGVGDSTLAGLEEGLKANGGVHEGAGAAAARVASRIDEAIRGKLEIHSPSALMDRHGRAVTAGLSQGMDATREGPATSIQAIGQRMVDAVLGLPARLGLVGTQASTGLASALGSRAGEVAERAGELARSAEGAMLGLPPAAAAAGGDAAAAFGGQIGASSAYADAQALAATASQGVARSQEDFAMASRSAALAYKQQVAASNAYGEAQALAATAVTALGHAEGGFARASAASAASYQGQLGSASAYGQGRHLAGTAADGLGSMSAHGAGVSFIQGFANGIQGVNIWQAAWNVGMSALSAIKAALGIHSPSREAIVVGEMFGKGTVIGMQRIVPDVEREAQRLSEAMALEPAPFEGTLLSSLIGEAPGTTLSSELLPPAPTRSLAAATGSGQASQPTRTVNVTMNVTIQVARGEEPEQAGSRIAKSLSEQLYVELQRRERTFA